jgi:hypothetical protein
MKRRTTTKRAILGDLIAAAVGSQGAIGSVLDQPVPADPYPLAAAGWGPEAGNGLYYLVAPGFSATLGAGKVLATSA